MKLERLIVWFEEVGKEDVALVGGKGANLGEMTQAGIPVPPGFIVTSTAYFAFLEASGLKERLSRLLNPLDAENSDELDRVATRVRQAISDAPFPEELAGSIIEAYDRLGRGPVAVRSSATAEDLAQASFAGQQRTFLNIVGGEALLRAVQDCWASLFEARAIFYRQRQGFDHLSVGIAIPVQRMVQSERSGVIFTVEPGTGDRSQVLIEAVYGLGEAIVSGEVTPDTYLVDKAELRLLEKRVVPQEWRLERNPEARGNHEETNVKLPVLGRERWAPKLTEAEIIELARLAIAIEEHYAYPQDIEWAREGGRFYIVQTRPVTTLLRGPVTPVAERKDRAILTGLAASPGTATGPVQTVSSVAGLGKVRQGDILVARMTTPDFVTAMTRAKAIVTDEGGMTSHAAIVSREMGLPCVVGTKVATRILKDGQVVTVDGTAGKVYFGEREIVERGAEAPRERIATRTRLYVILAVPELAEAVAARDCDGVGLLRAEFIISHFIGEHPNHMISQGRGYEFAEKLAQGITTFARAFYPRPVVYRTTDFKTNEYRNLKGGEKYEEVEENPMLGYRGCSRYVGDVNILRLEMEAIKMVRAEYNNLWVMLPFVRTVSELVEAKGLMEAEGLRRSPDFKLWMMAEVPSNIFLLDEFLGVGIDGISIGSNDLTQFILGIDRDNQKLAHVFDERNPAVLTALERIIRMASRRGVTSSICGQAPSVYPEITRKLVRWGITSISVTPDMLEKTRRIIARVEERLQRSASP